MWNTTTYPWVTIASMFGPSRRHPGICKISGNLQNLINDIVDLSRIVAEPKPIDVSTLADECADALKRVLLLGGTLTAESKVDVGSTFTVRIGNYVED